MQRRVLTENEVEKFVLENHYRVKKGKEFLSRCIDGRYDKTADLAPCAKPGADIGELMIVLAVNRECGFEIKTEDVFKAVVKTVGGYKNFKFHTDDQYWQKSGGNRLGNPYRQALSVNRQETKNQKTKRKNDTGSEAVKHLTTDELLGCGHFKQAAKDPKAYGLTGEEIEKINKFLEKALKKGAECVTLKGEHEEGAVLVVKGENWSLAPKLAVDNLAMKQWDNRTIETFVYQKTLDDQRRRRLAKNLLSLINSSIKFDQEYLYEILSQVSDNHLFETLQRLAKDLPTFEVKFERRGDFEVKKI